MNKYFFSFILFIVTSFAVAQPEKSLHLKFNGTFNNTALEENKTYVSSNLDSLKIDVLKFYISSIQIHYKNGTSFSETKSFHLLDMDDPASFNIDLAGASTATISSLSFNLGIDSTTSVSGALGGDLDPAKGMYWAWQSGYINFKLEGTSSSCHTRKNEFHFHLGGYMQPNYSMRKITLPVTAISNNEIIIQTDLAKFFNALHLVLSNSVMIPGKEAMDLSDKAVNIFSIK